MRRKEGPTDGQNRYGYYSSLQYQQCGGAVKSDDDDEIFARTTSDIKMVCHALILDAHKL